MPATVNIPLTTLKSGTYSFGPAAVADTDSSIALSIDRTVSGGLNSKTSTTTITMTSYQSGDGGATWQELAENTITGGIFTKGGNQINTDQVVTTLDAGTGRQVKAQVVVSSPGAGVAVQGTLVTS